MAIQVPKRVLVTGGAGFLGSRLCEQLVAAGHEVLCVDNFYTGMRANIAHLLPRPNFELLRHDITFPLYVEVDEIYNLACPASTSEVYGDPAEHPQGEAYWGNINPVGPRACYDEGKRCAETLFFDYQRQHGVRVKAARIFNTYGPRMRPDDGRVISNFIVQALDHRPLTLYGDGAQTRSFCYVDDLVHALIRLMQTPDDFCGPINLGNPREFTVRELAERIIRLSGSSSSIVQATLPPNDPARRRPDISLARQALAWEPRIGLEDGLRRTIGYFAGVDMAR